MRSASGGVLRRCLAGSALAVTLVGCGTGDDGEGDAGLPGSESPSPSESASKSPSEAPSAAEDAGTNADGECGGGDLETKVVQAAEGVELTVPAEWRVKPGGKGPVTGARLFPPDRGLGDGFLVAEKVGQTLEEAEEEALSATRDAAETTSEQDLDLDGFQAASMTTFRYDDEDQTFAVNVVAVTDSGVRVVANMTREPSEEQALAESCLSTIAYLR